MNTEVRYLEKLLQAESTAAKHGFIHTEAALARLIHMESRHLFSDVDPALPNQPSSDDRNNLATMSNKLGLY